MISAETIRQAKLNINKSRAEKLNLYPVNKGFHFVSFLTGLAVGLIVGFFILLITVLMTI